MALPLTSCDTEVVIVLLQFGQVLFTGEDTEASISVCDWVMACLGCCVIAGRLD